MARKKNHKMKPGYITLEYELLESQEWQKLTPKTQTIYIYMRRKFRGNNEDDIRFTYKEAKAKYKISQPTLQRAIKDLTDSGIIKLIAKGGKCHFPAIFSLRGKYWGYYI